MEWKPSSKSNPRANTNFHHSLLVQCMTWSATFFQRRIISPSLVAVAAVFLQSNRVLPSWALLHSTLWPKELATRLLSFPRMCRWVCAVGWTLRGGICGCLQASTPSSWMQVGKDWLRGKESPLRAGFQKESQLSLFCHSFLTHHHQGYIRVLGD